MTMANEATAPLIEELRSSEGKALWRQRIGLNSIWLLAARVGSQGLAMLFTALIARHLGDAILGQFAFLAAILMLGNVISSFGMDTLLIREIATTGQAGGSSMNAVLRLQLLLSILFIGATALLAPLLPNQTTATVPALRLISLALIPQAFLTTYGAALRAFERMAPVLIITVSAALFQVTGVVIVIINGGGLIGLAQVILLATAAGAGLSWLLLRPSLPNAGRTKTVRAGDLWRTFRGSGTLALLMFLAVLYQRLGVLLLAQMAGDADAGWFSAAGRIIEAMKILPYAFYGAYFPVSARVSGRLKERESALYRATGTLTSDTTEEAGHQRFRRISFLGMASFAVLSAGLLGLVAEPLIQLIYGTGFGEAVHILRLLAWSLPPFVISLSASVSLVSSGREKGAAAAALLALTVSGLMMAILIPKLGAQGTALAVVGAEWIQACILIFIVRRVGK